MGLDKSRWNKAVVDESASFKFGYLVLGIPVILICFELRQGINSILFIGARVGEYYSFLKTKADPYRTQLR